MMALEDALLDILVCPTDKRALLYLPDDAVLYNPRLRRLYRIDEGIPVMLANQAVVVPDEEHDRLMTRAGLGKFTAGADSEELARQLVNGQSGLADDHDCPRQPRADRRAWRHASVRVVQHEPHSGRAQRRGERASAANGAV